MVHSSYINFYDHIFEGMTLQKYTHDLTFSVVKYHKKLFSEHLLPINLVKPPLVDIADNYCIAVRLLKI